MTYKAQWLKALDKFNATTLLYPSQSAPEGTECKICWDTGICAECLGEYPHECPALCGDGSCSCRGGNDVVI